ncbi:ribosome maturation factor RimM [Secundilactobacillus paracollinoides]|uniref:Ribosome maturation factor RimM n=1 Tax=Secundilactobacillus paracollinoides TaxID=240427 RepID=A0A1B2J156_9LACO|nr:ribosome maturation factor RimM [Secundilactobacillus paracollinoides]ANZ62107.1 ribosome maturation factor RimM [Secundilactobacillus paracollinoides]ANZ63795.1 ribosome maturation factor RimM [Secundilactobacillus paracollinoides]ANZ68055.1 ribosome maturation factor RimM [Secundilactobacillus paracollinoides]KRL76473.1 16S rRNA-processing protein RimM [Secundilactobacillus paracollinoides DSM 15502 = JCM 11969]
MYYKVGTIVNTHGIRGELKVVTTTDFPDQRFKKGSQLAVFKKESDQKPKQTITIASSRQHKGFMLITLEGVADINEVLPLKGTTLKVSDDNLSDSDLDDGQYYYHQIIGLAVVTEDGEHLGEIKEILAPGANDVWVVARPEKDDLLLPVIDQVVKRVELDKNQVVVELMEGLE